MVEACKNAKLPEPEYGTNGAFVWITFKRPSSNTNSDTNSDTSSIIVHGLSDKQKEVLSFCIFERSSREILDHIGVTYHSKNIEKFINSLVDAGHLKRTIPDTPNSPLQKYMTKKGMNLLECAI